jgi:tetratricopeptide (TPR) repeat protein
MRVEEAMEWCRTVLGRVANSPFATANTKANLGMLLAFRGEFDAGRALIMEADGTLQELGVLAGQAGAHALRGQRLTELELLAGRPEEAEREARRAAELLSALGDLYSLSSLLGTLGQALGQQGRDAEAESVARRAAELAAQDDVHAQVWWHMALSGVLARRNEAKQAERLAHEAVQVVQPTDVLGLQGTAWAALGFARARAGRAGAARRGPGQVRGQGDRAGRRPGPGRPRGPRRSEIVTEMAKTAARNSSRCGIRPNDVNDVREPLGPSERYKL